VVNGGDRAVQFAREVQGTRKLRLAIGEQQVAHLNSKKQQPPAELVAKVNKQTESLFKDTVDMNEKLTREKPGTRSLEQTKFLAELDGDTVAMAGKISAAHRQKTDIEGAQRIAHQNVGLTKRYVENIDDALKQVNESKKERVLNELKTSIAKLDPGSIRELEK